MYLLAPGFCFVRSCRHHQAAGQCLYRVGVRGRHKQNQPSCALKNQAGIIYIFHVRKIKCVLAVDGKLERLEGEWRIGRVAPLLLGPPPDDHSTFYSWSQLLLLLLLRPSKCYSFLAVIPSMLSECRMAWKARTFFTKWPTVPKLCEMCVQVTGMTLLSFAWGRKQGSDGRTNSHWNQRI